MISEQVLMKLSKQKIFLVKLFFWEVLLESSTIEFSQTCSVCSFKTDSSAKSDEKVKINKNIVVKILFKNINYYLKNLLKITFKAIFIAFREDCHFHKE